MISIGYNVRGSQFFISFLDEKFDLIPIIIYFTE